MLCGPLNGMAFGPNITPMYSALEQHRKLGSLVIAIDPGRFAGGALLAAAITAAITQLKSQNTEILSPGEPEYQMEKQRTNEGIPIDAGLMKEFLTWSNRLGIEPLS